MKREAMGISLYLRHLSEVYRHMTYQTMDVRPIAGALGAEIYGANLKDRDDSPMWPELRQAFLEYHVIAVRGQDLSPADLMRVGGKFGAPAH